MLSKTDEYLIRYFIQSNIDSNNVINPDWEESLSIMINDIRDDYERGDFVG